MNRTAVATLTLGAALLWGAASPLSAQQAIQKKIQGKKGVVSRSAVINFLELARREALAPSQQEKPVVVPFMPMPGDWPVPAGVMAETKLQVEAEAAVTALVPAGATVSPLPSASFEGQRDSGTRIPPDTMGAAGPNHLMVTLNSVVRIQDKTGGGTERCNAKQFLVVHRVIGGLRSQDYL